MGQGRAAVLHAPHRNAMRAASTKHAAGFATRFDPVRHFTNTKATRKGWLLCLVVGGGYSANCSNKLLEAIQCASKLFDSVGVALAA
jgi:hypothetical protein